MHPVAILTLAIAAASTALAKYQTHCLAGDFAPSLPDNQTMLSIPSDAGLRFITIGHGVQNYTCSNTSTWTSVGAVARLLDASCIPPKFYDSLPALALSELNLVKPTHSRSRHTVRFTPGAILRSFKTLEGDPTATVPGDLGFHFFVNFNGTLEPEFDFTASQNDPSDLVVAAKVGSIPSPTNSTANVPWIQLKGLIGDLATTVFRLQTAGGSPPAECSNIGANLSVPYSAMYYFYDQVSD